MVSSYSTNNVPRISNTQEQREPQAQMWNVVSHASGIFQILKSSNH